MPCSPKRKDGAFFIFTYTKKPTGCPPVGFFFLCGLCTDQE